MLIAVDDGLVIGGNHQRSLVDGQCAVGVRDSVVLCRCVSGNDVVFAYVGGQRILARQRQAADNSLVVLILPALVRSGERRSFVAVDDGLVIGGDGQRRLAYRYLAVDEGNRVVRVADTARNDGVVAYIGSLGILACISDGAGEHTLVLLALPAGIRYSISRYGVAVDNLFVVRGSGQSCLGDGHYYRIRRLVVVMVVVTDNAVINAVGAGILSLRQSGIPTLLVIRGEGVLERTVPGCTGCHQCLCATVIGERVRHRIREGRIGFENAERTLDIGDVVVSRSLSGRGDVIRSYVAAGGIVARVCQFACQHVSRQVAALQTVVGYAEARSGKAVNNFFVLRGDGQRSLGDGYRNRFRSDVVVVVGVTLYLVIYSIGSGIQNLRQGVHPVRVVEAVEERTVRALACGNQCLLLAGINEFLHCLRRSENGIRLVDGQFAVDEGNLIVVCTHAAWDDGIFAGIGGRLIFA